MDQVDYFSLSDNAFEEIPREIFSYMPNIGTLDLSRMRLKAVRADDFKELANLRHLILATNQIQVLEKNSIPRSIENFHIGRNNIVSLNGTLKHLNDLKLLLIHSNNISDLEDELPYAPGLIMILASQNHIKKLPTMIKNYPNLNAIYIDFNELESFDSVFAYATKLQLIWANNNKINYIARDEFLEASAIDELNMSSNQIKSLNQSLLYIKSLRVANFSHNLLSEFSLEEVIGLRKLRMLDLSHNRIQTLSGHVEAAGGGCLLYELHLEHNSLKSLDGEALYPFK
jgi:Leucine-rich repeat (LRR) protein